VWIEKGTDRQYGHDCGSSFRLPLCSLAAVITTVSVVAAAVLPQSSPSTPLTRPGGVLRCERGSIKIHTLDSDGPRLTLLEEDAQRCVHRLCVFGSGDGRMRLAALTQKGVMLFDLGEEGGGGVPGVMRAANKLG
jgi:hypothetical protein